MKIAFRADSSHKIGSGHLSRCLNIAEALRERGAEATFIARDLEGNRNDWIQGRGFALKLLPPPRPGERPNHPLFHAHWLEVPWELDALQCREVLRQVAAHHLIIDHYALDALWEAEVRKDVPRLSVIDDLADRRHVCDILVDYALYPEPEKRYQSCVGPQARLLLGPSYCPLGQRFAQKRRPKNYEGQFRRVGVCLGAAERSGTTEKIVSAWISLMNYPALSLEVLLPGDHPNLHWFRDRASKGKLKILHSPIDTAEWFESCDLFVGAAGVSVWERACLGVPSLTVALAPNQVPAATALKEMGYLCLLGHADSLSTRDYEKAFERTLQYPDAVFHAASKAQALVDGSGAQRIADALLCVE